MKRALLLAVVAATMGAVAEAARVRANEVPVKKKKSKNKKGKGKSGKIGFHFVDRV